MSEAARCDDDFFCGECDDCLTNPDPENLPRGSAEYPVLTPCPPPPSTATGDVR